MAAKKRGAKRGPKKRKTAKKGRRKGLSARSKALQKPVSGYTNPKGKVPTRLLIERYNKLGKDLEKRVIGGKKRK